MITSTVTIDLDENGLREEHVEESTSTSTASAMTMMFAFLLFAAVAHVGPFVLQKLKDDVSLTETSGGGGFGWGGIALLATLHGSVGDHQRMVQTKRGSASRTIENRGTRTDDRSKRTDAG